MEKFVIEINFFLNLEIKSGFGDNPKEICFSLSRLAKDLKARGRAEFFLPPRVRDEFMTFVKGDEAWVRDIFSILTIKSPNIEKIQFPVEVFYKLVDEIRERSYRGLKIAEEMTDQSAKNIMGKGELDKIEYQKQLGITITKLRDRYRQATRVNFLDSVADLDLIVLCRELDGFLVSSDEGVVRWGRIFGVKEIPPQDLKRRLEAL